MICIKTRHFSCHRILLLAIGLWPCKRSKLVQFQIILFLGILITSIIAQLTVFVTAELSFDNLINVLSTGLLLMMFTIVYYSFWFNFTEIIERPLEELQHICNELKDENEIVIIKKYGDDMKRFVYIIVLWHICNLIIALTVFSLPIMPRSFTAILHINESQSRRLLYNFIPKYLIDQEKHLYLILLYFDASICIGGTVMVATGLTFISYLKHVCGMLKIASYRIEKAMNTWKKTCSRSETIMYKEIIDAIDIHRTAIKFSTLLFSFLHLSQFCLIMIGVICLSLNLYAMSETVLHGNSIDKFLIHFVIVIVIFVYLFFTNYVGQELTDHNNDVFYTVYNVPWYVAPLRVQRLILFLLQKGSKTLNLNFGGIFILSLQFFAELTKVSISYFTVMCSIH